jgi:hypothetical protein
MYVPPLEIRKHLNYLTCSNRPLRCLDCGGKWINSGEYLDHLEEFHYINGVMNSKGYVLYSMNFSPTVLSGESMVRRIIGN